MYKIEVHNRINQVMSILHFSGICQDANRSDYRHWLLKVTQLSAYVYYPIGLFGAFLLSNNKLESMFMGIATIIVFVVMIRSYYFIQNKDEIIELVHSLGTHVIRKKALNQVYLDVNTKIKRFVDFVSLFLSMICIEFVIAVILAFISNGKQLPLNVYFPWKENKIVYWFAFGFAAYTVNWFCQCITSNLIIWHLMMSCALKYEILGNELKNVGVVCMKETTLMKKQKMFLEDLIELLKNHQCLQDTTDKLKAIFSNLFFIQFITSGVNICGTLFAMTFISTENRMEYVFYAVVMLYIAFEIFMITYFGNEIKIWSGRLSYSLFECDWLDQSDSCKKNMIILMEVLKRPQLLIVGNLYPLDLQLFSKVLNFAYSLFNVLMHFKANN